jgi:hypothetical protein
VNFGESERPRIKNQQSTQRYEFPAIRIVLPAEFDTATGVSGISREPRVSATSRAWLMSRRHREALPHLFIVQMMPSPSRAAFARLWLPSTAWLRLDG